MHQPCLHETDIVHFSTSNVDPVARGILRNLVYYSLKAKTAKKPDEVRSAFLGRHITTQATVEDFQKYIGSAENVMFYNRPQNNILMDSKKKRVLFTSGFGTGQANKIALAEAQSKHRLMFPGKTSVLMAKTMQLAEEKQDVLYVVVKAYSFGAGDTGTNKHSPSHLEQHLKTQFQRYGDHVKVVGCNRIREINETSVRSCDVS